MKIARLLLSLLVVSLLLLACGPTAQPVAQEPTTPAPDPTDDGLTPPVTPHPDDPERPASGWGSGTPQPPKPTPAVPYFQEAPTKPPLPETPEPTRTPPAVHPEGLEACKVYGEFGPSGLIEEGQYFHWCAEETTVAIEEACNGLDTVDEQLACGIEFMSEYIYLMLREGPHRCFAIDRERYRGERQACLEGIGEQMDIAVREFHDNWDRLRAGGDAHPDVVEARGRTMDCLADQGHGSVDPDLLLFWQVKHHPEDFRARMEAQTDAERALEEQVFYTSVGCATEHGLFEAQEMAWIAELERMVQEEPEVATPLVSEGVLDALYREGLPDFLTGGPSY